LSISKMSTHKCESEGCHKQSSFGNIGQKPQFCAEHKAVDMVNTTSERCDFLECNKRPNYGIFGEKASFCANHKHVGMVNVR
jgi:hypothetical protein